RRLLDDARRRLISCFFWTSSRANTVLFAPATQGDRMLARSQVVLAALAVLLVAPPVPRAAAAFVEFESGQVRPLALSPDHTRLFAVNTPDDRLEIFSVDGSGNLTHTGSVAVGLEPVAVAARTNGEVW